MVHNNTHSEIQPGRKNGILLRNELYDVCKRGQVNRNACKETVVFTDRTSGANNKTRVSWTKKSRVVGGFPSDVIIEKVYSYLTNTVAKVRKIVGKNLN